LRARREDNKIVPVDAAKQRAPLRREDHDRSRAIDEDEIA